jgi:hypothetical protein
MKKRLRGRVSPLKKTSSFSHSAESSKEALLLCCTRRAAKSCGRSQ